MPLDPQARLLLDTLEAAGGPPLEEMEPPAARQMYLELLPPGEEDDGTAVEDRRIPGPAGDLGVRIYRPPGDEPHPGVVFFHGGGWVIGDLETHDRFCRALCRDGGAVVVSVDYRLAPENRFPAAVEDCWTAARWTAENAADLDIDPERIAVAGDSAGGNLAAVVAQLARARGGPQLAFQLLLCPVAEYGFDTASYRECAEGYLLTREGMRWFWHHYLGDPARGADPMASPLRAESLEGLPAAHVVTAEFDPLRDEGEAYAARLREAGVAVTSRRYEGQIHNFFTMGHALEAGRAACAEIAALLGSALRSPGEPRRR